MNQEEQCINKQEQPMYFSQHNTFDSELDIEQRTQLKYFPSITEIDLKQENPQLHNESQKTINLQDKITIQKHKQKQKKQQPEQKVSNQIQKRNPTLCWEEITFKVPLLISDKNTHKFYLYGDFYFDLTKRKEQLEEQEFLTQNKHKPNISVQQSLKYDCVYLNIGSQQYNMSLPTYSEHLVHILNSQQEQFSHELAELLKQYAQKTKQILESYKKIQQLYQFDPTIFSEREKLFEKYCEEILENLEKENKIYLLCKRRLNYQTGNLEYYQYVLSKGLIYLLGLDVQTFVQISMRSGRPNIFDSFTNIQFIEMQLQYILYNKCNHINKDIKIITLDGSSVPVSIQFQIHNFEDKFPKQYQINDKCYLQNVLGVIEIDVDPAILQQIIHNREQKKAIIDCNLQLLSQNFMYNHESHQFLLKYYLYNYQNQITFKKYLKKRN